MISEQKRIIMNKVSKRYISGTIRSATIAYKSLREASSCNDDLAKKEAISLSFDELMELYKYEVKWLYSHKYNILCEDGWFSRDDIDYMRTNILKSPMYMEICKMLGNELKDI